MAGETNSPADRVQAHTNSQVNLEIQREILRSIDFYSKRLDQIEERLDELDREWDIERVLEANAASISLAGLVLGTVFSRKWLVLPLVVCSFLLQHAVQGWCPPLLWFRRIGVRTAGEIAQERYALKAVRGDFKDVEAVSPASRKKSERASAEAA